MPFMPMARTLLFAVCTALVGAGVGHAQLPLPVTTPDLPVQRIDDLTRDVRDQLDRSLEDVRQIELRDLLRANRDVLERGPRRTVIIRSEILAIDPTDTLISAAQAAGFRIRRQEILTGLGTRIVVFEPPRRWSTRRALRRLEDLAPDGIFDFNHIYSRSGSTTAASQVNTIQPTLAGFRPRIGVVDTGIESSHPSMSMTRVTERAIGVSDYVPAVHGTQVSSLIAGQAGGFQAPSAGAEIFSADVYGGAPTGGSAEALSAALGWMAEENVPVINISIVGPPNRILEAVVSRMSARGHLIVAAVGNDGPSARPLYPAAYEFVVGVTAVSASGRIIPEAARGDHIDFAAPGAEMIAAVPEGGFAEIRGTSFAAPLVTGLLAQQMDRPDPILAQNAVRQLESQARDTGRNGRDRIYGVGIVGENYRFDSYAVTGERGRYAD